MADQRRGPGSGGGAPPGAPVRPAPEAPRRSFDADQDVETRVTRPNMSTVTAVSDEFNALVKALGPQRGGEADPGGQRHRGAGPPPPAPDLPGRPSSQGRAPAPAQVAPQPVPMGPLPSASAKPLVVFSASTTAPTPGQAPSAGEPRAADSSSQSLVRHTQMDALANPVHGARVIAHRLERSAISDRRLILALAPDSERAAAFRVLRHRLVEKGNPRVIVVTSARPKEGKTTLAVNLALALGECGRARVALLEANLRAPALARMLEFTPPVCFAEQLASHRERPLEPWETVAILTPYLHVAAVNPESTSHPLLDAVAFSIATDQFKQADYDYIVIDTPPVLGTADVNLVQEGADAVVFAASQRRSHSRDLRRAIEQLSPEKILGVVLLET